jgi:hypothetical protein
MLTSVPFLAYQLCVLPYLPIDNTDDIAYDCANDSTSFHKTFRIVRAVNGNDNKRNSTAAWRLRINLSRVLTNHPRVSAETRERVQQAVRELEYRPNIVARRLKLTRTQVIGLIIPDISNDFYATAASKQG